MPIHRLPLHLAIAALAGLAACATREAEPDASGGPRVERPEQPAGPVQHGAASYYGPQFAGRTTASGERFDPDSNMAAHRTLPLGTHARVTNLRNGRSTTVRIRDRGPYVAGRIIDLSPRTAETLGMKQEGVAPVQVTPILPAAPLQREASAGAR